MKKDPKKTHVKLSSLEKKAQTVFNRFIRIRDSKGGWFKCISCGEEKPIKVMNAGHLWPVNKSLGYAFMRYDENNVNGECVHCNCWNEAHLLLYRKNLLKKIGLDAYEQLEDRAEFCKKTKPQFTRYDLEEVIKTYTKKILEL